jgi:hypothetical protein
MLSLTSLIKKTTFWIVFEEKVKQDLLNVIECTWKTRSEDINEA